MTESFEPTLTTTDWNEEWKRMQAARQRADDASMWDAKAKTFPVKHGSQTGYVKRFIELANILPGDTVLDMGCGTGALATPLAQSGHRVIACDFSRGMLDIMRADQEQLGVDNVETHEMSWTDDWDAFGLTENSVDVALASRSIATYDLLDSLMKLNRVARRQACVTLPCGPSPKIDERLLEAAGFENRLGRDFVYAFNILVSQKINPTIAYIPSTRTEKFHSFADALVNYSRIVADAMAPIATREELDAIPEHLHLWLDENLIEDEDGLRLAKNRVITWAFIAWEPISSQ